ncbi:MAG: Rrf2 family transcriptional regulator [Ignavibacteriales bacterium]|nr:Rrf2 family transcriptional regulator [Ignavibacteriales bacterium]
MKFSTVEEYGLRCLLRIAKFYEVGKSFTIPEIARVEGITEHTAGKILRQLRLGGFLESSRGQIGGYTLTRPPEKIFVGEVLQSLGGKLFDDSFCNSHSGIFDICTNSIDCSLRSLWRAVQNAVDSVVGNMTLKDLLANQIDFEINETKTYFDMSHLVDDKLNK